MSAYKSILVPLGDAEAGVVALDAALRLARRFDGHVVGFHVRFDATLAVPLAGEGMSGAMIEDMISRAEIQGDQRAGAARAAFEAACQRHAIPLLATPGGAGGPSAEWAETTGREDEAVAWRGRLSDLLVFGHCGGDAEAAAMMTLNDALMGSGRPLLLCPANPPASDFGSSVAIAWNGSAEAARAVGWAMPLLRRAQAVTILSVSEHAARPIDAPAGELASYLAWNGVAAAVSVVQASAAHAGDELLRQAQAAKADLLVMGAYTHSRLRQLILGGVTRHVIAHAPLHVLMCH